MKKALILSTILLLSDQNTFTAEAAEPNPDSPQFELIVSFSSKNTNFALSPRGNTLAMINSSQLTILDPGKKDCKELRAPAPNGGNKFFTNVDFAGDGSLVATTYSPEIWNPKTEECWVASGKNSVSHAQLSPDGSRLLTIGEATATVWNVEEKKPLRSLRNISSLFWHNPDSSFWSNDGNLIALPLSGNFAVGVWNDQSPKPLHVLSGHTAIATSIAFSPDQKQIATASLDNTVRLWCLETGDCLKKLEGHTERCSNLFFTPSGQVITPSLDKTVRVWNPETGECLKVLEGHRNAIISAAFCRETGTLVTGSMDETARIWDIKTGKLLQIIDCSGRVDKAAFNQDGTMLAIGSGKTDKEVMTIQVLAILPKTYFELLNSTLYDNQELKRGLSALRAKEQDKEATIKRLWQLFREEIDSPHFDIDKAQLLLRELEYLKVVIPETINKFMLNKTPPEKLFPLNEQRK